ncbi:transposase [Streptosporangium canum]|uniref:transposase n=1 Tax=Streptosporangium canum TaxID=324952 RepID=UPI00343CDCDE
MCGPALVTLDGDAFDAVTCAYLSRLAATPPVAATNGRAAPPGLAVDGTTLRGSRTGDGVTHLLAATRHDIQTVMAQAQVAAKSNEIPAFTPLLSRIDLTSVVITADADALHTQHEHARQIVAAGGHCLFIVSWTNIAAAIDHYRSHPALKRLLGNFSDTAHPGR